MFWKMFVRKPKDMSLFDKLVSIIGTDIIWVYNGRNYYGERNKTPIEFDTEKWFKIGVGRFVSGLGDWGGGFERTTCAVAEVYIDNYANILSVSANQPFYNSPTRKSDETLYDKVMLEVDKMKPFLQGGSHVKLETRDQWLRGVLDAIINVTCFYGADLWSHPMTISKH